MTITSYNYDNYEHIYDGIYLYYTHYYTCRSYSSRYRLVVSSDIIGIFKRGKVGCVRTLAIVYDTFFPNILAKHIVTVTLQYTL